MLRKKKKKKKDKYRDKEMKPAPKRGTYKTK